MKDASVVFPPTTRFPFESLSITDKVVVPDDVPKNQGNLLGKHRRQFEWGTIQIKRRKIAIEKHLIILLGHIDSFFCLKY